MRAEEIFNICMAMIDEMTATGLDEQTIADYKKKTPYILTMLQNELVGIENRYRKVAEQIKPVPIEDLDDVLQIDDIKANTLLTNGLAANLMLHEDTALANYFEQRYEEMKGMFLKPKPQKPISKEDVYDATLSY